MTDPAGQITEYAYDSSGRLSRVTYPDATFRTYHYNESANTAGANLPNALTGITDERGVRFATYRYDATGRAVSTELSGSVNRYQVSFPNTANRTVTDPLGVVRTYSFTTIANALYNTSIHSAPCPACGPAARSFDVNGNVSGTTDWNGFRTTYGYDLARNLETSRTEGLDGNGTVRPESRTIQTEWHTSFRLPTKLTEQNNTGTALRETSMAYDTRGNLVSRAVKDVASGWTRTWTWTHTYSSAVPGLIEQSVEDGPRNDVQDVITTTFDPVNGNLLSVSRQVNGSSSLTTTYSNHDAHGNARTITDENGVSTTLAFDARQRLTSMTIAGETLAYAYDAAGLLTRVTQPDGSRIDYGYDGAQRLIGIEDGVGNRIDYTLDAMGNRTAEQVRDAGGALRQSRTRVYSALNRLAQEIGAAGQTSAFGYDNQGNLTTVDGPLAGLADVTSRLHDALNRLTRTTAPDGGQVSVLYNALDQTAQVTDPRSIPTAYTVDALGNETQEVSRDRGTTTRTFDSAGSVATETDAAGRVTTYTRDALGRVTRSVHAQSGQATITQDFSWDQGQYGAGRLTAFTDPGGGTAFQYDARGRVIAKTQVTGPIALTVQYRYDAYGRLDRLTYPSGRQIGFALDANGRVASMTLGTAPLIGQVSYHPFGEVTGWDLSAASGTPRAARPRDLDGRITGYTLGAQTRALTYDAASRIVALSLPGQTIPVGYDANDRLTSFIAGATRSYTYDLNGNRLSRSNEPYVYEATSNRLQRVNSASGTSTLRLYGYDASGRAVSDGISAYDYDARGRLAVVTVTPGSPTSKVVFSGYNARGERVSKRVGGPANPATYFIYDEAGRLLGEYDLAGSAIQEIVWLGDLPVASLRGAAGASEIYYIYPDQIGTPRLMVNVMNQARWRWDLNEPFGGNQPSTSPSGLGSFTFNLRMPGQYADVETELFYNYFRDYDRFTGRYIQADPIGLAGGINTYKYAQSNPFMRVDPFGLWSIGIEGYFGLGFGVIVHATGNPLTGNGRVTGVSIRFGKGLGVQATWDPLGVRPGAGDAQCLPTGQSSSGVFGQAGIGALGVGLGGQLSGGFTTTVGSAGPRAIPMTGYAGADGQIPFGPSSGGYGKWGFAYGLGIEVTLH